MSKADYETIISFGPSGEKANVWSNDPAMMKRLEKIGAKPTEYCAEIDIPKKWIKISPQK